MNQDLTTDNYFHSTHISSPQIPQCSSPRGGGFIDMSLCNPRDRVIRRSLLYQIFANSCFLPHTGGGGAAGQTSGGESAMTAPASSQFPFCGGGGCRGCENCEESGRSGPGGFPPIKRAGGLYGGGGGSCCGYRAGGGGGYSRITLNLKSRERVKVRVGMAGRPYDPNGPAAPGICIIAWGQSIDPNGIFT